METISKERVKLHLEELMDGKGAEGKGLYKRFSIYQSLFRGVISKDPALADALITDCQKAQTALHTKEPY